MRGAQGRGAPSSVPWKGPFGKPDGGGRGLGGCPQWPSQAERRDRRGTQVGTSRPGRWPHTVLRLLSSLGPEPCDHQCSPRCPELGALGNGVQHQPGQNCKAASVRLCLPLVPGAFPCWLTPRTLSPPAGSHDPVLQENKPGWGEPVCSQAVPPGLAHGQCPVAPPGTPSPSLPPITSPVLSSELDQSCWAWPCHSHPRRRSGSGVLLSLGTPPAPVSRCGCQLHVYLQPPALSGAPRLRDPRGAKAGRGVSPCAGQAPQGRPLQALGGLLSAPSTRPSRWLTAGPTRTVPRGRQGRTATVSGPAFQDLPGLGGSGPGDPGWSASLLPVSRPPPHPCPGPMEIRGPGVCPVFSRHKDGPVRSVQWDPQDLRDPGLVSSGERRCARVSPPGPAPPPTTEPASHIPPPHRRKPLLLQAENFTLFIKNTVTFSKFNFSK